jgi:hypothetical protein
MLLIYRSNRPYIKRYDFRKFLIRNDNFTYFEMLGVLFCAFAHILYAINGKFFSGYRNLSCKKNELNIFPEKIVAAFSSAYSHPGFISIEELYLHLGRFITQTDEVLGENNEIE